MTGAFLWVAFAASAACWARWVGVPLARQLAAAAGRQVEAQDAEALSRRANCPNLPEPGAKVVARGGWCEWCRVTHDQRNDARFPAPRQGEMLCPGYLLTLARGGVCAHCGVPHARPYATAGARARAAR